MDETLKAIRSLSYVSSARVVGSYAKGKLHPKDIDILIRLNINDASLWKSRRQIKNDIQSIIKRTAPCLPTDVFVITSDKKRWRLRPWQDISTKKTTYDWE